MMMLVGALGFASLPGLDFDAGGALYASVNAIDDAGTGGDSLAIINKSTGAARIVGEFGDGIGTNGGHAGIEGIAFDPSTGTLYNSNRPSVS